MPYTANRAFTSQFVAMFVLANTASTSDVLIGGGVCADTRIRWTAGLTPTGSSFPASFIHKIQGGSSLIFWPGRIDHRVIIAPINQPGQLLPSHTQTTAAEVIHHRNKSFDVVDWYPTPSTVNPLLENKTNVKTKENRQTNVGEDSKK